jgi:hypothetical protein
MIAQLICRAHFCAAALAFAATLLLADAGSAAEHQLPGTHSFGKVAAECGGNGGQFSVSSDGSYGCGLVDSNGKVTTVDCTAKGSCVCDGPQCAAVVKRGIKGVRPVSGSAGTASSTPPSKHQIPTGNVARISNSGASSSGSNSGGGSSGHKH